MAKISKSDLIKQLAEKQHLSRRQATEILEGLVDLVGGALARGDSVHVAGFATFRVKERNPFVAHRPGTRDKVFVPIRNVVVFKTAKALKQRVAARAGRFVLYVSKDATALSGPLSQGLAPTGHTLRVAAGADDTLSVLRAEGKNAGAVLVDSLVPTEEVERICQEVKLDKGLNGVPTIRIYPEDGAGAAPKHLTFEADARIQEPFETSAVVEAVRHELERTNEERGYFKQQVNITIPSTLDEVERAGSVVEEFMQRNTTLADVARNELVFAVTEGLNNAVLHGNGSNADLPVRVSCYVDAKKLTFAIEDQGGGFDYAPFLDRGTKESGLDVARGRNKLDRPGGLGIMTMLKCADELTYNSKGNRVTLVKNLA